MFFKSIRRLTPTLLWQGNSEYSNNIRVIDFGSYRKLLVNNVCQSGPEFKRNWKHLLNNIKNLLPKGINITFILGLGGGDVIYSIKEIRPDYTFEIIELDQVVINTAVKYFGIRQSPNLKIFCQDAYKAVIAAVRKKKKYQLICLDLYTGNDLSDFISDMSFISNIKKLLEKNGICLINFSGSSPDFAQKYLEKTLIQSFGQYKKIKISKYTYYILKIK